MGFAFGPSIYLEQGRPGEGALGEDVGFDLLHRTVHFLGLEVKHGPVRALRPAAARLCRLFRCCFRVSN